MMANQRRISSKLGFVFVLSSLLLAKLQCFVTKRTELCRLSSKYRPTLGEEVKGRHELLAFQATNVVTGAKISLGDISSDDFISKIDGKMPIVLTSVFEGLDHEKWCDDFFGRFQDELVDFQVKRAKDGYVELFEDILTSFVEGLQEESCHEEAWYLLDELLLFGSKEGQELKDRVSHRPVQYFGENLFDLFPKSLRPKDACLIIGGVGSRSFLHADPYEWTGTNILLEGKKIWFFFPPNTIHPSLLEAKRNPPVAWDSQIYNISAGWQSPVDLFKFVDEEEDGNIVFSSGTPLDEDDTFQEQCLVLIQEEGDMVLIPPGWWHQVYNPEPSIAVASQYMNGNNKDRVFDHILTWCGLPPFKDQKCSSLGDVKDQVDSVLRLAFHSRYGEEQGEMMMVKSKMTMNDDENTSAAGDEKKS